MLRELLSVITDNVLLGFLVKLMNFLADKVDSATIIIRLMLTV